MKRKLFSKMLLVGLMLCVGAIVHPADGQSDTDTKEKEAMLIQAVCRGALARQNQTAEEKNQQGQEREQDTAATTVQAACRGFLSREELAESVNIGALPGAGELPSFIASNSSESSGTDTSSEYSDAPDNKNQSSNVLQELNLDQKLDNLLAINDQDINQALTYAFENNLLWAVQPLLQRDIQAHWADGVVTPLHYAVLLNHLESVRYLLTQAAIDLDVLSSFGQTALMMAAKHGYAEIVELLLDRGARIDIIEDNKKRTALMIAVANGHTIIVKLLLDKEGILIDAFDWDGYTVLTLAALLGNVEIVKLLLNRGADVNAVDQNKKEIALIAAAKKKIRADGECVEIVKLLLDRGAHIDAIDRWGNIALISASRDGCIEVVKLLLDGGAHIDAIDEWGYTALMRATREGYTEIVKILAQKANVDAINKRGFTALRYAAELGHTEIIKTLIKQKANVNAADKYGDTALIQAVRCRHVEIVGMLLAEEAQVDAVNEDGSTALKWAVRHGHAQMAQMLIDGYRRQLAQLYPGILLQITDEDLVQFDKNARVQSVGCAFNQVGEIIAGWMADEDRTQFEKTQCRLFIKSAINGNSMKSQAIKEKLFDVFINSVLQKCSERPIDPEKREECEKREKIIALLHEALRQGHVPIVSAAQPVCAMTAREPNEGLDANIAGPAPRALDCAVAWQQARNNDGFALLLEDQQREVDGGAASQERIAADREIRGQQDEEYAKSLAIDRQRNVERQVMLEREQAETAAQELALGREREDERARIAAQEREDAANRPRSIEELRARRLAALDGNNATEKDGGSGN